MLASSPWFIDASSDTHYKIGRLRYSGSKRAPEWMPRQSCSSVLHFAFRNGSETIARLRLHPLLAPHAARPPVLHAFERAVEPC